MSFIQKADKSLAQPGLRGHAVRFALLTTGSLATQLAALGTGHLDGKVLAAALMGAVLAAYRQWATSAGAGPGPTPAPAAPAVTAPTAAAPTGPQSPAAGSTKGAAS